MIISEHASLIAWEQRLSEIDFFLECSQYDSMTYIDHLKEIEELKEYISSDTAYILARRWKVLARD